MTSQAEELLKKFDRVILCCGASNPRDIKVPGRDAKGIYFAVDFLKKVTKTLLDSDFTKAPYEDAKGKHVLVIGGGDTGNDCVGTSVRLGAKSVTQLEMMPMPPSRACSLQPVAGVAEGSENRLRSGGGYCRIRTRPTCLPDYSH